MKIELYLVPNDENVKLIKDFLVKNNLSFKEFIYKGINQSSEISKIKIIRNHAVLACHGFNELFLNQELIKHIKKYKCEIERDF